MSPPSYYTVFKSTKVNCVRGISERVFYVKSDNGFRRPIKPEYGIFNNDLAYQHQRICEWYRRNSDDCQRMSVNRFVETCAPAKKMIYRNTALRLDGMEGDQQRHARIKSFVKVEKVEHLLKDDPVNRMISPRTPEYCLSLGRFLRPLEPLTYNAIDHMYGTKTVMKGLNALEVARVIVAKWKKFNDPVAIDIDMNRFDQHVSVPALKWEHSIYSSAYSGSDHTLIRRLLKLQLQNYATCNTTDGFVIKYGYRGTRCSGDMNTALGNILIMCSIIHAYKRHIKVPFELVNNGDDSVIICDRSHLKIITETFLPFCARFGFSGRAGSPAYTLEKISFCQTQPVYNGEEYVMCRIPAAALAKDTIMTYPARTAPELEVWRSTVGVGGLSLTDGLPVFPNFYHALARGSSKPPNFRHAQWAGTGMAHMARGMKYRARTITDSARHSYFLAFGSTPSEQRVMERYYDNVVVEKEVVKYNFGLAPLGFETQTSLPHRDYILAHNATFPIPIQKDFQETKPRTQRAHLSIEPGPWKEEKKRHAHFYEDHQTSI